ncbi:MAG: 4'-phosphopantetheinyl transferase superfamily protein [Gammaproteobacteria bacterium]|jgi:4'-phosphopantetheinyl transferase|nr:4'-phosphopantetheinyl transferase superfamily protein [Gammaproteobacteria bacterium]
MADIQTNEIDLWLVENEKVTEQAMLDEYQGLLNSEEQKRLEHFVFPKHKKQFLISRALVRTVLGQYLEQPPESLVFARNAYGKPRIASFEKTAPISFNLSHTNDLSVLAVSQNNELGVDAEYLTRKVDILKLANRYFSKQEYDELAALDVKEFDKRFFKLWTLKEAYIKACGMGMAIPLRDFSFSFNNEEIAISFSEERDDLPERWQFWQFDYKSKFQLALAQKRKSKEGLKKIVIKQGRPLGKFSAFKPNNLVGSL